jgi:hypothetical protein
MKDTATNNKKQKGEMLIRNSIYKNYAAVSERRHGGKNSGNLNLKLL